jgi:cold shock CspA family protein
MKRFFLVLVLFFSAFSLFSQSQKAQDLLEEVTYPIAMHEIIDNRVNKSSAQINNLFVPKSEKSDKIKLKTNTTQIKTIKSTVNGENEFQEGEIHSIKQGYGFIKYPPNNLFFHYQSVIEIDFNELEPGDKVQFKIVKNDRGENVATEVKYIE